MKLLEQKFAGHPVFPEADTGLPLYAENTGWSAHKDYSTTFFKRE